MCLPCASLVSRSYREYPDPRYDGYRERPPPPSRHTSGALAQDRNSPAWRSGSELSSSGPGSHPGRRADWQDRGWDARQREWDARDGRREREAGNAYGSGHYYDRERGERERDSRRAYEDRAREDVAARARYPTARGAVSSSGPARAAWQEESVRGDRYGYSRVPSGAASSTASQPRGAWRRSQSPTRSSSPRSSSKRSSPAPSRRPSSPPPSAGSVSGAPPYRAREGWEDTERDRSRRISVEASRYEADAYRAGSGSLPLHAPWSSQEASSSEGRNTLAQKYGEAGTSAAQPANLDSSTRRGSMITADPYDRNSSDAGQVPTGPAARDRTGSTASSAIPNAPRSVLPRIYDRPSTYNSILLPRLTQIYASSLASMRSVHDMHNSEPQLSLRKALQDLADADMELAGARARTSVTEASLESIRNEAELWSTESARLEIEQRNSGMEGYWKSRFNEPPVSMSSSGQQGAAAVAHPATS